MSNLVHQRISWLRIILLLINVLHLDHTIAEGLRDSRRKKSYHATSVIMINGQSSVQSCERRHYHATNALVV
uniref:Uncharacterized protein n=1 Tax=Pristionchus pacificus TaxID=54126 RepID=A0A2A6BNQ3_PRIPA|eukprot:PDM67413.1 hypothetical protein PRIPAC_48830 [Pristionchus pacificus]